jgi:hypothetical protein
MDSLGVRQRSRREAERPGALARWKARWHAVVRFFT